MHIQVIVIVGDRSISEEGDVGWENVIKDQMLYSHTSKPYSPVEFRSKASGIGDDTFFLIKKLVEEYLFKLTKSSEGNT